MTQSNNVSPNNFALLNFQNDKPYLYFFPLGVLFSIIGALIWLPFSLKRSSFYPIEEHSVIMYGGFLLSFASGFLMTAVPRFTQTKLISTSEFIYSWLPLIAAFFILLFQHFLHLPFWILTFLFLLNFISLCLFVFKRFLTTPGSPPETFLFVSYGLGFGLIGLCVFFLKYFISIDANTVTFAKNLFFYDFSSILLLGIGGRLIPGILGFDFSNFLFKKFHFNRSEVLYFYFSLALMIFISSVVKSYFSIFWGQTIHSVLFALISLNFWKIYKKPAIRSKLTWSIWAGCWSFILGHIGAIWTTYSIHFYHLFFISGLGLITLMISTRVILAHGGYQNTEMEKTNKIYWWLLGLTLLASTTRMTAGLMSKIYLSHLLYASITWTIVAILWIFFLVPKIYRTLKR